jgi:hypothetical protein
VWRVNESRPTNKRKYCWRWIRMRSGYILYYNTYIIFSLDTRSNRAFFDLITVPVTRHFTESESRAFVKKKKLKKSYDNKSLRKLPQSPLAGSQCRGMTHDRSLFSNYRHVINRIYNIHKSVISNGKLLYIYIYYYHFQFSLRCEICTMK